MGEATQYEPAEPEPSGKKYRSGKMNTVIDKELYLSFNTFYNWKDIQPPQRAAGTFRLDKILKYPAQPEYQPLFMEFLGYTDVPGQGFSICGKAKSFLGPDEFEKDFDGSIKSCIDLIKDEKNLGKYLQQLKQELASKGKHERLAELESMIENYEENKDKVFKLYRVLLSKVIEHLLPKENLAIIPLDWFYDTKITRMGFDNEKKLLKYQGVFYVKDNILYWSDTKSMNGSAVVFRSKDLDTIKKELEKELQLDKEEGVKLHPHIEENYGEITDDYLDKRETVFREQKKIIIPSHIKIPDKEENTPFFRHIPLFNIEEPNQLVTIHCGKYAVNFQRSIMLVQNFSPKQAGG